METMQFKTNAKCGGCVAQIASRLNNIVRQEQWSVDLKSPDRTLSVTTDLPEQAIVDAVHEAGFMAERIENI